MEISIRGYSKSFKAGYNECNEMWKEKIKEMLEEYKGGGYYEVEQVLSELLGE